MVSRIQPPSESSTARETVETQRPGRSQQRVLAHSPERGLDVYVHFASVLHSTLHLGPGDGVCVVSPAMTPDELLLAACPTIGTLGSAFYFIPETAAKGKEQGLDAFRLYFLGRGGVLGDTSAAVVASAFGYFHHDLVTKMWNTAKTKISPTAAAALYWEACAELGRAKLADVDGLEAFVGAAEQVIVAADDTGLALFSGIKQMPPAADPAGRAMQVIAVLREFRGSAHLVAVRSVGLADTRAHFIKRPDMVEFFGWTAADAAVVTDEDRAKLDRAETVTDLIVQPAYAVLDEAGQQALLHGLTGVQAALQPAA